MIRDNKWITERTLQAEPPKVSAFVLHNVSKSFRNGRNKETVLNNLSLSIIEGAITGIVGPSGCGKSTLMHLLGATDSPDSGKIYYKRELLTERSQKEIQEFRGNEVAWIFQNLNLVPHLDVVRNVELPLRACGVPRYITKRVALRLLHAVGIPEKKRSDVCKLSGGERQRVAIARAIASGANVILADEPTGSLDDESSKSVMKLLKDVNRRYGTTIILITHEKDMAREVCDFIIDLNHLKKAPQQVGFHGVKPEEFGANIIVHRPKIKMRSIVAL